MSEQFLKIFQEDVVSGSEEVVFSFGVVIFVKNEAGFIGQLIDRISQRINQRDIFVVDGHSTDGTVAIVKQKNVCCFLDNGKGKGAAIRFAIQEIKRDVLVFMDGDGSHQPEEISFLIEPFSRDKEVVMVTGSRFKGGSEELSSSPQEIIRRAGNLLSTFIINARWRVKLTDTQNGFRALRRSAVLELGLREDTFAIEQELVMKCLMNGLKIIEVPSFELKRVYGKSHIIPCEMLPRYISCFLSNIFNRSRNT